MVSPTAVISFTSEHITRVTQFSCECSYYKASIAFSKMLYALLGRKKGMDHFLLTVLDRNEG